MGQTNVNFHGSIRVLIRDVHNIVWNRKAVSAVYLSDFVTKFTTEENLKPNLSFLLNRYFYKRNTRESYSQMQLVADEIKERLGIDFYTTMLNSSSVAFAYHVITTGKCIFERDCGERVSYEIALKGHFYDLYPFVKPLDTQTGEGIIQERTNKFF